MKGEKRRRDRSSLMIPVLMTPPSVHPSRSETCSESKEVCTIVNPSPPLCHINPKEKAHIREPNERIGETQKENIKNPKGKDYQQEVKKGPLFCRMSLSQQNLCIFA